MRDYEAVAKQAKVCASRKYCDIGGNCEYYDLDVCCQDGEKDILKDAADAIEELLAELVTIRNQLPKWVSAEDELPEENKQIISYLAYKGMAVLQYENKHFYMQGAFQPLPKEAVTHWMPLPTPPKGVE